MVQGMRVEHMASQRWVISGSFGGLGGAENDACGTMSLASLGDSVGGVRGRQNQKSDIVTCKEEGEGERKEAACDDFGTLIVALSVFVGSSVMSRFRHASVAFCEA